MRGQIGRMVLISVLLIAVSNLYSQEAPGQSRTSSYYTYLYRLSEEQSEIILKKGWKKLDESFLKNLAYTYPTDSLPDEFSFGNYLKVYAVKNDIEYEFLSISNIEIRIQNNGTDLNLVALDLEGNELNTPEINLNNRTLKYDEAISAYRIRKNNAKGILKTSYEGVTSYLGLERDIDYSKFRRSFNSVAYGIPLKYISTPVELVIKAPYHFFLSFKRRYPQGIFYYSSKPFADIVRSISYGEAQGFIRPIACIFDDYHCRDKDFDGFLAFNKPKYRPGDTVRVKAYILNHKQKLYDKDIELWVGSRWYFRKKESKFLTSTRPYQPGFYETSFVLHDSLDLKLDSEHKIYLVNKDEMLINDSFYYEDYELDNTSFTLKLSDGEIQAGDSLKVIVSGKDSNGLNVKDASVELTIKPGIVHEITSDSLYINNTIWSAKKSLDPAGETTLDIPSSIFYNADIEYDVIAKFQTADFEVHDKAKSVRHLLYKSEIAHSFNEGILDLKLIIQDTVVKENATIMGYDDKGRALDSINIVLPYSLKLNPLVQEYYVESRYLNKSISIDRLNSNVEVFAERDPDSLHIQLANPRKLNVRYSLYKGNKQIEVGSGSDWNLDIKTTTKKEYFLSIQYIWAGQAYDENYTISLPSSQLKVLTNSPGTIYPGKKVDIQIAVSDYKGNPVEGVDITSFGVTKKFETYNTPQLPSFNNISKERKLINNFDIDGNGLENPTLKRNLNWQKWNALMTLDSISYYQLIYPEGGYYNKPFSISDSITQFAPYVLKNGYFIPIHIIYVDEIPIYFSMTDHEQFYSFQVRPGYHKIALRTYNEEIRMDSVYITPNKKSIIGIDMDVSQKNLRIITKPPELTYNEHKLAEKYLTIVDNLDKYKYVKQEDRIFWVSEERDESTIGPLLPYVDTKYIVREYYEQEFQYESGYNYSIRNNLIKMISEDDISYYFPLLMNQSLNDEVLTEKKIDEILKAIELNKQVNYEYFEYPSESRSGYGAFAFWNPYPNQLRVKNYLLFKEKDPSYIRVFGGSQPIFHDLEPDNYHVYALLYDNDFIEERSVVVKPNSAYYMRIDSTMIQHSDSVSHYINDMILREVKDVHYTNYTRYRDRSRIRSIYHSTRPRHELEGNVIIGRITDDAGEPLPGVNVLIKGTTSGTQTDLNGYYRVSVPNGGMLVFSYVGFETQEVYVGARSVIDITMGGATELQEVVVVAYGTTYSRALQGMATGVKITSFSGAGSAASIKVRGSSAISGSSQPLYVIDGVIYNGKLDLNPNDIKSMEVLKGEAATSLYGTRAVNGVIMISLNENSEAKKIIRSQALDLGAFPDISQANPLRRNFSDYAFWEPKAQTDKNGIANINVTFPDDVTTWNTFFLAVKDNKQSGSTNEEIRSFKPILATLSLPRFMVVDDTTAVLGRVSNYTKDTLKLTSTFVLEEDLIDNSVSVTSSHMDSLEVVAPARDSLEIKYSIETSTGYEDGELRKIPIYRKGILESKGIFKVLKAKESLVLTTDSMQGNFTLYAKGNLLSTLIDELKHVQNYPYACNEQKASKLLALIYERRIRTMLSEEFKHDKKIKSYIKKLIKASNKDGSWGWWPEGRPVNWISKHVVTALLEARKDGFDVPYSTELMKDQLIAEIHRVDEDDLEKVELLDLMDSDIDYVEVLQKFDSVKLSLEKRLRLILLKQRIGLDNYTLDELWENKIETMLGGMYWESENRWVYSNSLLVTLNAYKILRNEDGFEKEQESILNYLIQNRKRGYWRNTYESIKILEGILPDLLKDHSEIKEAKLTIEGDANHSVGSFPLSKDLTLSNEIKLTNSGAGPLFISAYQTTFNPTPEKVSKDFIVTTKYDSMILEKGKETTMTIEITNDKEGEYVMVEVPIPAGTTYANKPRAKNNEVHREYYRDRMAVFFQHLPVGTHHIDISLLPRYSGTYTINPAKAELMYFPTFYGREAMKKVQVR